MITEKIKTVEDHILERDSLIRMIEERLFSSDYIDMLCGSEFCSETAELLAEGLVEFACQEDNFDNLTRAKLLFFFERVHKMNTKIIKLLQEQLHNKGIVKTQFGDTELSVSVYTDGIKKEIRQYNNRAILREKEQIGIEAGLRKVRQ